MNITEINNGLILENVKDFNVTHIFDCGQCFRWNKEDNGSYTGVVKNKVINVSQNGSNIIFKNINIDDYENIIKSYFDIDTDYSDIKKSINKDDIMGKAIKYGEGIRILNQDEWETMISFMISANNRIPMIKKVIENLSKNFGEYICTYKNKEYYQFPTPKRLSESSLEKIKDCKAGFRSERIKEAAIRFLNEKDIIYDLKNRSYDEGLEYLKTYKGIGDKVANCILLFSMKQFYTFPVDVWVRRVMQTLYVDKNTSDKEIRQFAENKFGKLSGYAQQYLFYYARELAIGK
ncbi:DNA-3-methyladenine glycosylase family protein [Sedimentibacter sp. MB31-C6]|uniref:DNA-3-methyladenine glycosylase family protein n=1 Tax=Sedimentibacter sp. MB31-C6 TaxID=3109366 RepID=UPI002DDCF478|nr:DNA glycosylase [Sedimentibacter sp. MB36-C1]WSI04048.1 DNA glycosylase [Sedimentibacter sp. MB36-C1]